jgi:hypothetical protein
VPASGDFQRPEKAVIDHFPPPQHSQARQGHNGTAPTVPAVTRNVICL